MGEVIEQEIETGSGRQIEIWSGGRSEEGEGMVIETS